MVSAYCARCRRRIDGESFSYWQGTAWCRSCRTVVQGTYFQVPLWVVGTSLFMALRLGIH